MITEYSNRFDIIDSMRTKWKRRIHPSIVAFESYIEGFADAKSFEYDNTWDVISIWVHDFLGTETAAARMHWTQSIVKASPIEECQIVIFYAALDDGRGTTYERISTFNPSQNWKDNFSRIQERFFFSELDRAMPAPSCIEIVKEAADNYILFYYDKDGLRYYEVFQENETKLKSWAKSCLNIPTEAWVPY